MSGILEYSTTAASNTAVNSIGVQGTNSISNVDNALRQMMADSASAVTRHATKTTGSYSAAKTDFNQFWRATGAVTVNLAAAATLTDGWCIWLKADGGAITVDPNSTEQINGASTLTISDGNGAFVLCTGSAFYAIVFVSPSALVAGYQPLDADLTTLATAFTTASASGPASLQFAEDTDNGTNKVTVIAPASLAGDVTLTLPSASGTALTSADILDEDDMASDSATKVPSQQSVKAYVDAKGSVGAGQTWQSPARSLGTTYQNTTGGPIEVVIDGSTSSGGGNNITWQVSSDNFASSNITLGAIPGSWRGALSFVVPNNWYYRATHTGGTLQNWRELRP